MPNGQTIYKKKLNVANETAQSFLSPLERQTSGQLTLLGTNFEVFFMAEASLIRRKTVLVGYTTTVKTF
jgi:hypothetical protein